MNVRVNVRLDRLGRQHAPVILAGQDDALTREITGRRWEAGPLDEFLDRCSRWRDDGPIREFAAVDPRTDELIGGGGLNRMAPGLEAGQASLTYWLLASYRGHGWSRSLTESLVDVAHDDPRIRQLVLLIAEGNAHSGAVARRLGARWSGRVERHPADALRTVDRWVLDLA